MKKFLILTCVLLVLTIYLAFRYFSNLSVDTRKSDAVLASIPADAALVLEFSHDRTFYEIFRDYPLFEYLLGHGRSEKIQDIRQVLDAHPKVAALLDDQKVFVSLHHDRDSVSLLWSAGLKEAVPDKKLIASLGGPEAVRKAGNLFALSLKDRKEPFFLLMDGTTAAGSFSRTLLEKVAAKKTPGLGSDFIREINAGTAGSRNSILNLFIDYRTLLPFLGSFYREKLSGNFSLLNNISGFSTLNMNFKSDAMMFNGITRVDTVKPSYLGIFLHQQAAESTMMRLIPQSTANAIQFALTDYGRFEKDLRGLFRARGELEKLQADLKRMTAETGIDPERDIRENWAPEFSTFQTANHERFGMIRVRDGRKLGFLLEPLSREAADGIRRLDYPNLLYFYFGDPFRSFKKPYYYITDNLLIFSNSQAGLRNYISDYQRQHFLYTTPRYRSFEQLVSNQSNISLFIHNGNSRSITRSSLKGTFGGSFSARNSPLRNFYGLSYQWTSDDGHFFTNLYLATVQEEEPVPAISDSLLRSIDTLIK